MNIFKGCPGAENIRNPHPEEIRCSCGNMIEIWSDELSVVCGKCGKEVKKDDLPSCLDWCSMAKECVGEDKYNEYLKSKKRRK
jgi:hypothetical protein